MCSFVTTGGFFQNGNPYHNFRIMYKQSKNNYEFYLKPYGLTYDNDYSEFDLLVDKVSDDIENQKTILKLNFKIEEGGMEGFLVEPLEEYRLKILREEQLFIDEMNATSKTSDELVSDFAVNTNMQLTYPFYWIDAIKKMEGSKFNCNNYIPTVECEGCSFESFGEVKEIIIENKEEEEEQEELPQPPKPKKETIGRMLYNKLVETFGENVEYTKFEKEGWNTFTIEKQNTHFKFKDADNTGSYQLILSDTYIQEGDLMSDPTIWVTMNPNLKIALPTAYENHGLGVNKEYVDFEKKAITHVRESTDVAHFIIDNLIPSLHDRGMFDNKKSQTTNFATRIKLLEKVLAKDPENKVVKSRLKLLKLKNK
jgi:hypothetical protein